MQTSGTYEQPFVMDGVHRTLDSAMLAQSSRGGGLTRWQLLRVQAQVDSNLSNAISNQQLADCVRLSRFHFARAFRQSTGMSPQTYVSRRRIERASTLLRSTDAPLCQIAVACGFWDQSHFNRRFSRALGTSPRSWRKALMD
jgi:AraC family transcriptional regulator